MIERTQLQTLISRIHEPRKFIQVIMGPRQTGKTTLAHQLMSKTHIACFYESADAVNAGDAIWLEHTWEAARVKMRNRKTTDFILIIDEIQKIQGWSEMVKKLWDEDTRNGLSIKVILLGSSRLLLQSGLTESLAGRFETIYMDHWSYHEMKNAFNWTAGQYAWFGGYPGSASLIDDEERWKHYISTSLIETSVSRDILMLTRIDKPALLKRLFELGCLYSGQILSFTKLQGQLHDAGNTTTLSHYLELLNSAGLIGGIEKYAPNIIKKRSSSPKFQVHNNALLAAQHKMSYTEIIENPVEWGRIVESAVGAYLMNISMKGSLTLSYWKERDAEVDFVLESHGQLIALEIKSNDSGHLKGLKQFKKFYPSAETMLIGKTGLPWQEFLLTDPLELF